MSFETVQWHAHNLGVSLRQTIQQSAQSSSSRVPLGVKVLVPRGSSTKSVNSTETADAEEYPSKGDFPTIAALESALASTTTGNNVSTPSGTPSGTNRHPWNPPMPRSPSPSVVSIPTRWWASPGGSVRSEPPARTGITKPVLCFLCYEPGHYLADALGYLLYSKERLPPIARLINGANVPERRIVMRIPTRAPLSIEEVRPQ
jgi:hypothetical protein